MAIPHSSNHDAASIAQRMKPVAASVPHQILDDIRIELVDQVDDLQPYVWDWQRLCEDCAEPNVFHAPWMLIPAIEQLAESRSPRVAFLYRQSARQADPPLLIGVVPLIRCRGYQGLPIAVWKLWTHRHCFLNTPLIRAGQEVPALAALFDWISRSGSATAIELSDIHGEGPIHRALVHLLDGPERTSFTVRRSCRAFLQKGETFEQYLSGLSGHHRREFRRQRRKLEKLGRLELRAMDCGDAVQSWIDAFLELEARGWKGRVRTALAKDERDRQLFQHIAREAAQREQMEMLGLFLDDRPIALKCNFRMGRGGYGFKIAYDERYARYSPGVQLELENIRTVLTSGCIDWMDSCAVAGHPMIDRLWKERRVIQTTLISSGRPGSDAILATYPALRAANREIRRLLRRPKSSSGKSS